MFSLSPQLQRLHKRFSDCLRLRLFRWLFLRRMGRRFSDAGGWFTRLLTRPVLLSLRTVGVLLLCGWFVVVICEMGLEMVRPFLLLLGAALCWWTVDLLEE